MLTEAQLMSFYQNDELEQVEEQVDQFLKQTSSLVANDEFYRLTTHFKEACRRSVELESEICQLESEWTTLRASVWDHENRVLTHKGKCDEGRWASGTYSVAVSKFSEGLAEKLQLLTKTLAEAKLDKATLVHTERNLSRIRCGCFVEKCVRSFMTSFAIKPEYPAYLTLSAQAVQENQVRAKTNLISCCSVLFLFLRGMNLPKDFTSDLRTWLTLLMGALNRFATPTDHMFILNQLLRMPQGVAEWAGGFLQPSPQIDDLAKRKLLVDHFLAMLYLLFLPIRQREQYLIEYTQPKNENSWTFVDVDEFESDLVKIPESDLIVFLNQFNFETALGMMFTTFNNADNGSISVIAFALTTLKVLQEGLHSFNNAQYQNMCRRIGLMMKQVVECVAVTCRQSLLKGKSTTGSHDWCLHAEFDALICRCVIHILTIKKLGVWQILVSMPFDLLSMDSRYRLVHLLLNQDGLSLNELLDLPVESIKNSIENSRILDQRLLELHETDATYLLVAIGNLICMMNDARLIDSLATQVFNACFLHQTTRLTFHKTGRQVLRDVALKFDATVGMCLAFIDRNLNSLSGYALEMVASLPLENFLCEISHWLTIKRWLHFPLQSMPNALAQQILLGLNWKYKPGSKVPFLDPNLHMDVAASLADLYGQYCNHKRPKTLIDKASKIAYDTVDFADQFEKFCWDVLVRLKISKLDFSPSYDWQTHVHSAHINVDSLAGKYVHFQTNCHDLTKYPELFDVVAELLLNYKYLPAIVSTTTIVPMFVEEKFGLKESGWLQIVQNIVNCDETYLQYAKQLFVNPMAGSNLRTFADFVCYALSIASPDREHVDQYFTYIVQLLHYSNPKQWASNRSYLHVLDSVVMHWFLFDPKMKVSSRVVASLHEETLTNLNRQPKSLLSKIWGDANCPEILNETCYSANPWFAFACLNAEEILCQKIVEDFAQTLLKLHTTPADQVWKKVTAHHGKFMAIDRLPILVWMNLCKKLSPDHPLFALTLQKVSLQYFWLMKSVDPSIPPFVFGSRCSSILQQKMCDFVDYLNKSAIECSNKENLADIVKLMQSVKVWFKEQSLLEVNQSKNIQHLPLPDLLESILNGSKLPWMEYSDLTLQRNQISLRVDKCRKLRMSEPCPMKTAAMVSPRHSATTSLGHLLEKLSIDASHSSAISLAPMQLDADDYRSPDIDSTLLANYQQSVNFIDGLLNHLNAAAECMSLLRIKTVDLNDQYFADIRLLYQDVDMNIRIKLECFHSCSHPNFVQLNVKHSQLNSRLQNRSDENRNLFRTGVKRAEELACPDMCWKVYTLICVARRLCEVSFADHFDAKVRQLFQSNGIRLFYHVVGRMDEQSTQLPVSRIAFKEIIDQLGQSLILGNADQVEPMFHTLCFNRHFLGMLLPFFAPTRAPPSVLVGIYRELVDLNAEEKFWRMILLKMDGAEMLQKFTVEETMDFFTATIRGYAVANGKSYLKISQMYKSHCSTVLFMFYPRCFVRYVEILLINCVQLDLSDELLLDLLENLPSLDPDIAKEIILGVNGLLINWISCCETCAKLGLLHCFRKYCLLMCRLDKVCFEVLVGKERTCLEQNTEVQDAPCDLLRVLFDPWVLGAPPGSPPLWLEQDRALMDTAVFQLFSDCFQTMVQGFDETKSDQKVVVITWLWNYLTDFLLCPSPAWEKSFVCQSYELCCLKLPWHYFTPGIDDLKLMKNILQNYPNSTHPLITGIIVRINWCNLMQNATLQSDEDYKCKVDFHALLLELVTRCAARKENLTDCKASFPKMIGELYTLEWNVLDFGHLNDLLQFFLDTFGVDSVFSFQDDTCRCVLRLLEKAAEFLPLTPCQSVQGRMNRLQRRRQFVDMLMKCLQFYCQIKNSSSDFAGRYFVDAIDRVEVLMRMTDVQEQKIEEADLLLEPIVQVLDKIDNERCTAAIKLCLFAWLDAHADSDLLLCLISSFGKHIRHCQMMLTLQEKCLTVYFTRGNPKPQWNDVVKFLHISNNFLPNYVYECKSQNLWLSLFAFFMQQLPRCRQLSDETLILRDATPLFEIFLEKQSQEAIVLLYVGFVLELLQRQILYGAFCENLMVVVNQFCTTLQQLGAESRSGILGAIGLSSKKVTYTARLRLCCQLLLAFIQQQIINSSEKTELRVLKEQKNQNCKIPLVEALKPNRQFTTFSGSIDLTLEFLNEDEKTFLNVHELYSKLMLTLYNDKYLIDKCSI